MNKAEISKPEGYDTAKKQRLKEKALRQFRKEVVKHFKKVREEEHEKVTIFYYE